MSKEDFVIIITALRDEFEVELRLDRAINGLSIVEDVCLNFEKLPCYKALRTLLSKSFDKEQLELIDWWVYEDVEKVFLNQDGTIYKNVKEPEDFYDYLMG